ncbi:MAG: cache domain-containing protein [Verrucomicrobia bacterium]|nr:cache domain-containing protein [Verrucomicrobiota bacterium]
MITAAQRVLNEGTERLVVAPPAGPYRRVVRLPIATKLVLSFGLIIILTCAVFSVVGARIIGDRVVSEAQERVRTDLNSAREIYLNALAKIRDEVRFVSERTFVRDGSAYTDPRRLAQTLASIREKEHLDVLAITDRSGVVLLRTTASGVAGDDRSTDQLVRAVLDKREPVAAALIVSPEELRMESPRLAEQAHFEFVPTPKARTRTERHEAAGLMLKAAAPILDFENHFLGVAYGGVLLNRNFDIVDKIKQTVFQGMKYQGEDMGTATIFQDDLRISTNVKNEDGGRAIGTRAAEDVYKIMESERLALIGQLSAGVAHEINNPLQGIVTYSRLLLERMPAGGPGREFAQKIVTQADRCRDIIRGLLDFARPRKPDKRRSVVNVVLQECVSLVANQALFHNIEVVQDFDPNLPPVFMDPSQIQQVFMNLLINAAEAMAGGGKLTLSTRFDPAGKTVEVDFTDTGHGIREEDLERVFDPFFTTKEVGHGTGLGLAISFGIVKEHQGTISVESAVGQGATFIVRLPMSAEEGALAHAG